MHAGALRYSRATFTAACIDGEETGGGKVTTCADPQAWAFAAEAQTSNTSHARDVSQRLGKLDNLFVKVDVMPLITECAAIKKRRVLVVTAHSLLFDNAFGALKRLRGHSLWS
jgi:hypothetical protein